MRKTYTLTELQTRRGYYACGPCSTAYCLALNAVMAQMRRLPFWRANDAHRFAASCADANGVRFYKDGSFATSPDFLNPDAEVGAA